MQNQGFRWLQPNKLNEPGDKSSISRRIEDSKDTAHASYQVYFDNEVVRNVEDGQQARSYNFNFNSRVAQHSGSTFKREKAAKFSEPFNHDDTANSLHNRSSIASKMSKFTKPVHDAGQGADDHSNQINSVQDEETSDDVSSSNSSSTDEDDEDANGGDNFIIKCKIKNETSFVDDNGTRSSRGRSKLLKSGEESASFFRNKDLKNILFLMFLYLLQGVPLGLTGSLPFIMSSRNVSYKDQGTFSFAFWPFSLKLLWAPIVDTFYLKRFGRRKSWLVPMQYLIGLFLILFSNYVHLLLEGPNAPITHFDSAQVVTSGQAQSMVTTPTPLSNAATASDIYMLTFIFFMFTFMAATQDIAVDGWGLTILSK